MILMWEVGSSQNENEVSELLWNGVIVFIPQLRVFHLCQGQCLIKDFLGGGHYQNFPLNQSVFL